MLRPAGSAAGSIFTTGPRKTNVPVGPGRGAAATRSMSRRSSMTPKNPIRGRGMPGLIVRIPAAARGARAKCGTSTLLGNGWTLRMPVPLALVEALAAREHEVGARHQLAARARVSSGGAPANADSSSMQS